MKRALILATLVVLSLTFFAGCSRKPKPTNGEITGKEKEMQKEMMMKAKGGQRAAPPAKAHN